MKTLFTSLIALGVLAFGSVANAATISITPDGAGWTGLDNSNLDASEIATIVGFPGVGSTATLSDFYKADVNVIDDVVYAPAESGTYAGSYTTVFANTAGDPQDATITFDGDEGTNMFCTACFLYVKDGKSEPAYYVFDISTWNGIDELALTGFWPEGGAISHVTIYGYDNGDRGLEPPAVPIPAAVWLFGSGLIGLVAVGRRKV